MNPDIQRLYEIASKPQRLIIGLMSGTSLDGLDIALCQLLGSGPATSCTVLHFTTISYNNEIKEAISAVFSKREVDLEKLCLFNPWLARQHAQMILDCLAEWKIAASTIDLIASHGQTIYHAPTRLHQQSAFGNATLQIGDGDHLAVATGIITISDFRQKNIAAGGEGAPLAVYGDRILFSKAGEDRLLLNIGGIANFTFLPADLTKENIICTDTGPGNTIMDAYMRRTFPGKYFDEDGSVAKKGKVNHALLTALLEHPFFGQDFPKTTGPEMFNLEFLDAAINRTGLSDLSPEDIMATLVRFTAESIAMAITKCIEKKQGFDAFASGGGKHNPVLMRDLKALLPEINFKDTAELGIEPDAKEAVLFALLANECVAGNVFAGTKDIPAVAMGKISLPH